MRELGKTKVIDGNEYSVGQLYASDALEVSANLIKIVAPALGVFSEDKVDLDSDVSSLMMSRGIQILVDNLDNEKIKQAVKLFAKHTVVDGKELSNVFETHFQGRTLTMLKWFKFCLEVNFADFFPAITALSSKVAEVAE